MQIWWRKGGLRVKEEWIVYCGWCDKAIVRGEERQITEQGHFCSSNCLWNYLDENEE